MAMLVKLICLFILAKHQDVLNREHCISFEVCDPVNSHWLQEDRIKIQTLSFLTLYIDIAEWFKQQLLLAPGNTNFNILTQRMLWSSMHKAKKLFCSLVPKNCRILLLLSTFIEAKVLCRASHPVDFSSNEMLYVKKVSWAAALLCSFQLCWSDGLISSMKRWQRVLSTFKY